MKKNYLFGLLSLFTLLFAASCQEEELAGGQMGDTATVTFSVNTPTIATRAVGDGETATRLYVGIYEYGGNKADGALVGPLPASLLGLNGFEATEEFDDKVATVTLQLAKDKKYSIIFWAETANNGDAIFNMDWANRKLTLKPSLKANQESYDAFWKQIDVTLTGALSENVDLKRPFAQLNIGTSDKAAAEKVGLVVSESQVVVNGVYNTFDLQTGEATGEANVTYTMESIAGIKDQTFPATTTPKQEYIALNYLLMANDPSIVDVAFTYKDADDEAPYALNFTSVPMRRNYRTNIYGTLLTNSANYTVEIKPGFGNDDEEDAGNIVYVTSQAEFEEALKRNDENIVINLMPTQQKAATRAAGNANEFTIEVGANEEKYYLGGEDTDSITINANGCTINFVHKNTDWNYIRCVNDAAKWIINDAHLTNSGANDGPWNRHDIRFYNAVELNNVTSDKAIAVLNDGKLTNVTISEEGDVYGLWITAEGQTVELDNCTFKTAGRGIAIKDEYIDNPALVDLTVKNTKFNTEKKAAILVTSTAGANISLENVDLSGVKADGFNAVWVDEDRAEHADKVTVTGGFCVVEGETPTAENNPFLKENGEVNLPAGTFVMPTAVANGVTIIGAEDGTTVLDMTGANPSHKEGLTFKNVTINVGTESYHGIQHTTDVTYTGCVINGTLWLYSTAVFNNCTFNVEGDNYNVWTYGSTEATFNTCTFNCDGKSVLVYNEGHNGSVITMNTCQFFARAAVEGKAAVEIDSSLLPEGMTYVVNLNGCTVQGFDLGSVSNEMLFNQKKGSKATIYVDGNEIIAEGVGLDAKGSYQIYNAEGLKWVAEQLEESNNGLDDITIELIGDIDLSQFSFARSRTRSANTSNWNPIGTEENPFKGTFDGKGYTIKNLCIVEDEAKEGKAYIGFFGYAKDATIKNVTFENVYIDIPCLDIDHSQGHIGAVAGSLEGKCVVENVTVKGDIKVEATVTANGASRVAVVAGGNSYGNVTMKNVHVIANEGSYLKANNNVGALAGQLQGKSVFENCSSNIDVTGTKFFAGGIIGLAAGDQLFTDCRTTGNITITAGREGRAHDHYRVGGIAGGWADGAKNVCTLNNCSYTGTLSGTNADGSVAEKFDYWGYVGRGYTLNGCQGSKVVIDGVSFVQVNNTAAEAGIYDVINADGAYLVDDANGLVSALEQGKNVILMADIKIDPANMSNAYGTTGINVKNGQTIDGAGHTLNIKGAGGTWDSGINTTGGLIKNLTVTGSFRGIFINHNSTHSEKVVLENVTITGTTYTLSCDQGLYQGIEATNCTFNGWTSFAKTAGEAKFVNCYFGEGSGYKYCRPYSNTEFVNCTFCPGYAVDETQATVTFTNCTWEK